MDFSKFDRGVFVVNVLAIVYDPKSKKVLIGRVEKDKFIEKLSWCLPGGRPDYNETLEYYLKHEVKKKTNLDIDVKKIIFARTVPEHREFLLVYYYCEIISGTPNAGEKFVEIKWVKPNEVKNYFKHPPIDTRLIEFLESLNQ